MPLLKTVFLLSALGALPVFIRVEPLSIGGLTTGLIFLGSVIVFLGKPILPRSSVPIVLSLGLFWALNVFWTIRLLHEVDGLRNDVVVWGGMLFLTATALATFTRNGYQLAALEKIVRVSSYIYVAVLLCLVAMSSDEPATPQVGIVFFSYYLARLYQGDKRSMLFLMVIVLAQILMSARIVVAAELFLLMVGRIMARGFVLPDVGRPKLSTFVTSLVLVVAVLGMVYSNAFERDMFSGDAALRVGGVAINTSGRLYEWRLAIDSALEAPWFGHGTPGPPEMVRDPKWDHPHNDYIRIFHQSGIVGVFLWMLYVGQGFFKSLRGVRYFAGNSTEHRWCHATCMAISALSIMMITDNSIVYSYVVYPCAVMIGVSVALQAKARKNCRPISVDVSSNNVGPMSRSGEVE